MGKKLTVYIDVDDTIAISPKKDSGKEDFLYEEAEPIKENIRKANELYEKGHKIVYWTGRGGGTENDWHDLTKNQLEKWGCKYHDLKVGVYKPWDVIIDDTVLNTNDWKNQRIKEQF